MDQESCRDQPYDEMEVLSQSELTQLPKLKLIQSSEADARTPERNAGTPELLLTDDILKMFDASAERLLSETAGPSNSNETFHGPSLENTQPSSDDSGSLDVFAIYQNTGATTKWVNAENLEVCLANVDSMNESPNTKNELKLGIAQSLDQLDKIDPRLQSTNEVMDNICSDFLANQDWTQIASPIMNWNVAETCFSPISPPPLTAFSDFDQRGSCKRRPSIEVIETTLGKRLANQSSGAPVRKTNRIEVPSRRQLFQQKPVQGYISSLELGQDGSQNVSHSQHVASDHTASRSCGAPAAEACPGATERWRKQQQINGSNKGKQDGQTGNGPSIQRGSYGANGSSGDVSTSGSAPKHGSDFASEIQSTARFWECPFGWCKRAGFFSSAAQQKNHVTLHHNPTKFRCSICPTRRFKSIDDTMNHYSTDHHIVDLFCEVCGTVFDKATTLVTFVTHFNHCMRKYIVRKA